MHVLLDASISFCLLSEPIPEKYNHVSDENHIVVFRNGRMDGPYSRPAVIAALKSGALTPDTPARTAASPQLRPLREILDLAAPQAIVAEQPIETVVEPDFHHHAPAVQQRSNEGKPLILVISGIAISIVALFVTIALLVPPSGKSADSPNPEYSGEDITTHIAETVADAEKATLMVKHNEGSASAFIARSEDGTFVYTAAHAAVSDDLEFFDFRGKKISTEKNPEVVTGERGHDLVRFRLLQPYPTCLTFASREEIEAKPEVFALGDSGGEDVLTRLRGSVVGVGPDKVEVDCEFIQGNSGGPIVTETGKVVAVASYLTANSSIWTRDTQLEVRRFAWIPSGDLDWAPCKASQLREEAAAIEELWRSYCVLAALEQVTPGASGIEWDDDFTILNSLSIDQVFAEAKDHALVRGLHATSNEVTLQTSRGESEAQVTRNYQRFFDSCIAFLNGQLTETEGNIVSSFHRQQSALIRGELSEMINLFSRQSAAFERNPQLGRSLNSFR